MINVEPDTEAGSSHDEFQDSNQNTSAISFDELEEGKALSSTDTEMFPNFDQSKGGKEVSDAKKDSGKGKKPD